MGDRVQKFGIPKEKLRIEILNKKEEREHFHQDIELLFVLDGSLDVMMGNDVYHLQKEDLMVINANKRHHLKASDHILYMKLIIQWQLISDIFQSMDILFWCNSTLGENERYDELRKILKNLLNHYLNTQGDVHNFRHISLCYQVMDILSSYFFVNASNRINMTEQEKFDNRIEQINNYIRANYNLPISLKDLADKLYLSMGYLSRFFKKNYGMTFTEYLKNVRMYYALDELLYTDKPITKIVFDNGFSSVASFNEIFKDINGDTPSAVRKKHRELMKKNESIKINKKIKDHLEDFLRNDGIKKEESISISDEIKIEIPFELSDMSFPWKNMINIGSASELLKSEVREQIIFLKNTFDFTYIRFCNLFSNTMLLNKVREEQDYNFSKLDSILDFLIEQGIKPHIELGAKPKRIQKTLSQVLVKHQDGAEDLEEEDKKKILKAIVRHLNQRYKRREMTNWRFELWFEELMWNENGSMEHYLKNFQEIKQILTKYNNEIQVGGCGLRLNWEKNTLKKFLQEWNQSLIRPDFISAGFFGYERGSVDLDEYARRTTDNDFMLHEVENLKRFLKEEGFSTIPLYITEWSLSVSDRNYMNDTCFKGAYIIKNMFDIYDKAEIAAYYIGSDRITEYYDSGSLLYGGNGLISRDGILKPSGFAIDFLNRLYPKLVSKGKNYLLTTDGEHFGMILHNQKVLNYNYYLTEEDKIEKENIWKYFEDRDSLKLKFSLKNLPESAYKLKIYKVNEQNGSIFDVWKQMDFDTELSRDDIKYLKRVCEPKMQIQKKETKEGTLNFELDLYANEISYIQIEKILE